MTQIDQLDAARAIFLDFEGNARSSRNSSVAPPPILGGTLCDGRYEPVLLASCLREAAKSRRFESMEVSEYLGALLQRATREDRRIVHWSSREETVFLDHGFELGEYGLDAKKLAKPHFRSQFQQCRMARQTARDRSASTTARKAAQRVVLLAEVGREVGMQPPPGYGFGCAGKWVSAIREQAQRHNRYSDWSAGGKRKLTNLIKHNEYDCRATKLILNHIIER